MITGELAIMIGLIAIIFTVIIGLFFKISRTVLF